MIVCDADPIAPSRRIGGRLTAAARRQLSAYLFIALPPSWKSWPKAKDFVGNGLKPGTLMGPLHPPSSVKKLKSRLKTPSNAERKCFLAPKGPKATITIKGFIYSRPWLPM
jgi:hypothetical protein